MRPLRFTNYSTSKREMDQCTFIGGLLYNHIAGFLRMDCAAEGCAMGYKVIAFLLCVGTTAFCQSAPVNSEDLGWIEAAFTQPVPDLNKLPADWRMTNLAPPKTFIPPGAGAVQHRNHAQIDPGMIVHPPPSRVGVQPPGTLVARNLYPNLALQPIQWPRLKVQAIPTLWPRLKIGPCDSGVPVPTPKK